MINLKTALELEKEVNGLLSMLKKRQERIKELERENESKRKLIHDMRDRMARLRRERDAALREQEEG